MAMINTTILHLKIINISLKQQICFAQSLINTKSMQMMVTDLCVMNGILVVLTSVQ